MDIVLWDASKIVIVLLLLGFFLVPMVFACRMMNEKRKLYRAQQTSILRHFDSLPPEQVDVALATWRAKGLF